jgi:hypothetical protein
MTEDDGLRTWRISVVAFDNFSGEPLMEEFSRIETPKINEPSSDCDVDGFTDRGC